MFTTLLRLFLLGSCFTEGFSETVLTGGGATFPIALYQKWFSVYAQVDPSVKFTYEAVGSGRGQDLISNRVVDFGASDAPMNDESLDMSQGTIVHIPTVGGADVLIYNINGIKDLRLDGPTLAAIYLGKITQWNDPAIVAQNPTIKLPDEDITVVHRSDASGTSYIFTDYLCSISPEWKLKVGRFMSVSWPLGTGLKGNDAVSNYIAKTPGAIGYVELLYALKNNLAFASIKNDSGAYIKAGTDSITDALASATIPDDFRISIVNAPGPTAYPIAGLTWILVYQDPSEKSKKLIAFLKWAETEGQKMAPELNFAPLPASLQTRVLAKLDTIASKE